MDYLISNEVGLPLITTADVVDRPYRATCKNFHAHLLLHVACKPPGHTATPARRKTVRWVPGSAELWQSHTATRRFVEDLQRVSQDTGAPPDNLNDTVEQFLLREAL